MSTPALTLVPSPSLSLYDLSAELQCLLDTREMVEEGSADQAELDRQIAHFQDHLPRKVDAVCHMLDYVEAQAAQAKAEANRQFERLAKRQKHFESQAAALESYCVRVLENLEQPKRGPRKLEGEYNTLSLSTSERCEIAEPESIPAQYKTATVKMPAALWSQLVDTLFPETLEQIAVDISVRLADVKKALKGGVEIEGADIKYPKAVKRS